MLHLKVVSAFKFLDLNWLYQPIHVGIFEARYIKTRFRIVWLDLSELGVLNFSHLGAVLLEHLKFRSPKICSLVCHVRSTYLRFGRNTSIQILYSVGYLVEAPLAAISASSLLGYDTTTLHTWIWGFSPIRECRSSQTGWGLSVDSHFQISPEMFDWVQVRALAGPLK